MRPSFRIALLLLATTLPPVAEAADTLQRIGARKSIVIAHREASIPFSYLDKDGKPIGYAIDICMKVVEAIKRDLQLPQLEVKFLPVTPSTRIAAIAEGKADMECGSTTNTRSRREQVAFSIAYFIASAKMVVRADAGIRNWADLRGKKIVTTKGTTNARTLEERDKVRSLQLTLLESMDHAEAFSMVESRRADAFAMDDVLLYGFVASAKNPADFRVVGDALSAEPYAIMMRKDDEAFKAAVNKEVARLMISGEIHALYERWFSRPIPPHGINMNMRMSHLLRSTIQYPSDKIGDEL